MLLSNQWVREETKQEIKKSLEANGNENTAFQNIWNAAKAVLRRTFVVLRAYLQKQENFK